MGRKNRNEQNRDVGREKGEKKEDRKSKTERNLGRRVRMGRKRKMQRWKEIDKEEGAERPCDKMIKKRKVRGTGREEKERYGRGRE